MVKFECLIVYTCILLVWLNAPDALLTDSDAVKTKLIAIIIHKHLGAHKQVEEDAAEHFKNKTLSWQTQLYNTGNGSTMDEQGHLLWLYNHFWTFWYPRPKIHSDPWRDWTFHSQVYWWCFDLIHSAWSVYFMVQLFFPQVVQFLQMSDADKN